MFGPMIIETADPDQAINSSHTIGLDFQDWKNSVCGTENNLQAPKPAGNGCRDHRSQTTYNLSGSGNKRLMLTRSLKTNKDFNGIMHGDSNSTEDKGDRLIVPGQLIIHNDTKCFNTAEVLGLCTLFQITNAHHHSRTRYHDTELLVPGPLVLAATQSNVARFFDNVESEFHVQSLNMNKVNMTDQISTMTFVAETSIIPSATGTRKLLKVVHIGVKNLDFAECDFLTTGVPLSILDGSLDRPREYEKVLELECPELYKKIAARIVRYVVLN